MPIGGIRVRKACPAASRPCAGGDIDIVTAEGKLVVIANFGSAAKFDGMKSTPNYRAPLSGLGDAAVGGPSTDIMPTLYIVGFKKGDRSAILTMFFKKGSATATVLTMDQLKALAAVVASRM